MALTDANGEERKGIEIRFRCHGKVIGFIAVSRLDVSLTIRDIYTYLTTEERETIRDLMLAGF